MNDFSTNKTGFIQADTQYTVDVTVDNTGFIHDLCANKYHPRLPVF